MKGLFVGLSVRNIRLLRSVALLLEYGQIESAESLCRSIFESALVERFTLRDPPDKEALRAPIPDGQEPVGFRVRLYVAHEAISKCSNFAELFSPENRKLLEIDAEEASRDIGQAWTEVLTKYPHTFSGLSIRQTARKYDLWDFYQRTYSIQSRSIHAGNAFSFLELDEASNTASVFFAVDVERTPHIMELAVVTAMLFAEEVNAHFAVGADAEIKAIADVIKNRNQSNT